MLIRLPDRVPEVASSSWIAPNATVVGAVTVGERCGVWYGAVLRADLETVTLGDETNIQDNSVLHADPGAPLTVGARVSVGHNATLHGCTIEDDVLVGMGARVLNRATIGAGSLIAAGAVIPEGMQVPPRSLVAGVPAKVRRDLTDEEVEIIGLNAQVYVDLAATHRDGEVDAG
ncbi:gamma carbonic anhydrase family protein [Flexivirga sp. ID2601S]|uniref:Gamma carbonic anhydrase family protein n=1 Tax=Flexivirga aerilata TaxID=1656889 RepID=A0A849AI39_9MICO|nr:gamma carbonic anhydrase family protein [Flexivirga aerilata]NNG39517.1 gamma carbonic anhydrase family protein [Flexivirga aerilata]